jgi:hypothetical protein
MVIHESTATALRTSREYLSYTRWTYHSTASNDQKLARERFVMFPKGCRHTGIAQLDNIASSRPRHLRGKPIMRDITPCRFHKISHEASANPFFPFEKYNFDTTINDSIKISI